MHTHAVLPMASTLLAGQAAHATAPGIGATVKGGHWPHATAPLEAANVPDWHGAHVAFCHESPVLLLLAALPGEHTVVDIFNEISEKQALLESVSGVPPVSKLPASPSWLLALLPSGQCIHEARASGITPLRALLLRGIPHRLVSRKQCLSAIRCALHGIHGRTSSPNTPTVLLLQL